MADRRVTRTGKDSDGDITKLCGAWGGTSKAQAIRDIRREELTPTLSTRLFYVASSVRVITVGYKKYLRTTADGASKNNLDNLPDC